MCLHLPYFMLQSRGCKNHTFCCRPFHISCVFHGDGLIKRKNWLFECCQGFCLFIWWQLYIVLNSRESCCMFSVIDIIVRKWSYIHFYILFFFQISKKLFCYQSINAIINFPRYILIEGWSKWLMNNFQQFLLLTAKPLPYFYSLLW